VPPRQRGVVTTGGVTIRRNYIGSLQVRKLCAPVCMLLELPPRDPEGVADGHIEVLVGGRRRSPQSRSCGANGGEASAATRNTASSLGDSIFRTAGETSRRVSWGSPEQPDEPTNAPLGSNRSSW